MPREVIIIIKLQHSQVFFYNIILVECKKEVSFWDFLKMSLVYFYFNEKQKLCRKRFKVKLCTNNVLL